MAKVASKTQPSYNMNEINIKRLTDKAKFVYVDDSGKMSERLFSGSQKLWKSDRPEENSIIYNTEIRLSATPETFKRTLKSIGLKDADINKYIKNSVTASNYENEPFRTYVANENKLREDINSRKNHSSNYNLEDLSWIVSNIKSAKLVVVDENMQAQPFVPKMNKSSLESKIKDLPDDKIIDVSTMDLKTHTGAKYVKLPLGKNNKKAHVDGIPLLSSDYNRYLAALKVFASGSENVEAEYAEQLDSVQKQIKDMKAGVSRKAKTAAKTTTKSKAAAKPKKTRKPKVVESEPEETSAEPEAEPEPEPKPATTTVPKIGSKLTGAKRFSSPNSKVKTTGAPGKKTIPAIGIKKN